jgi:hypothetical protein
MPRTRSPDPPAAGALGAAVMGASLLAFLMRVPASPYGPVCGHGAGQLHCAACYAAAALVVLGLGLASLSLTPLPSSRRFRV